MLLFSSPTFSALQRAEIAEIALKHAQTGVVLPFSALQRAEIAEMERDALRALQAIFLSVLFNEPKLLKCQLRPRTTQVPRLSVLFNEPKLLKFNLNPANERSQSLFQCSSTSRNC